MNKTEAMKELESLGSEQSRRTFARHGVGKNHFGVSYADLYKLQKRIKTDQKLAEQLWATGNHDARILATLIADPAQMTASKLDAWVKQVTNQLLSDALAGLAAGSPTARTPMERWIASKDEWIGATGWHLLAALAGRDSDIGDEYFERFLDRIERKIHRSKNRVRHSMNGAVISIGVRNPSLRKKALAAAKRIGKVEVDHGDTSCKTPDAAAYIRKVVEYRKKTKTKSKAGV